MARALHRRPLGGGRHTIKVESLFLDISKYLIAYKSVEKAFEVFFLLYCPWRAWYATGRPTVDLRRSEELREALSSRQNPYVLFLRTPEVPIQENES